MTSPGPVNPAVTTTAIAPLFVDHSELIAYNQAVAATAFRSPGPGQSTTQQFWSTDPRPADSPVQETLEISLASSRLVNWLKYDVSIFPHLLRVEYHDQARDRWVPLLNPARHPVRQQISRSIPIQLPNPTHVPGRMHPQHSFLGHWRTLEIPTLPTYLQRVRLILKRVDNGLGPVDVLGRAVDYSLAIRHLSFGYRVTKRGEVPRTLPHDETYSKSFATTEDLLGSSLSFALREPVVQRILGNTDTSADTVWICEPQPYPGAVVCFYADVRDAKGRPQLVDQIFVSPINSGAHVTVYWSLDRPVGNFDAPFSPLSDSQAIRTGNVAIEDGRLVFGEYGELAHLVIRNQVLGYEPTLPWWLGVVVRASFDRGADTAEHPIADCGLWRLSLTGEGLSLTIFDAEGVADRRSCPIAYSAGTDISLVLSYDGAGGFRLHARTDFDDQELAFWTQPWPDTECSQLVLGADTSGQYLLNCALAHLVLKEEPGTEADLFLDNPDSYCTVAEFAADDLPQSRQALLRLDPGATHLIGPNHPYGLFGGVGVKYENLVWSPVPRDFQLQRGWMYLPPTKARFLKLEITNLQAIPYDIAVPGPQQVKSFPPEVYAHYRARLQNTGSDTQPVGVALQSGLASRFSYDDVPIYVSSGGNGDRGYTNTEVYIADDYTTGLRLRTLRGDDWAYQTFHVGNDAPRFYGAQKHRYAEETIVRTGKIAYQAGLRQIVFAMSSFTTQQDTGMYDETFYTQQNLLTNPDYTNIVYDEDYDALTSGTSSQAKARSLVYTSLRDVRAVQYAVEQTPPTQILPDPDFGDPTFSNWRFVGDVDPPVEGLLGSPVFGTLLPVNRSLNLGYWGDIAQVYHTWGGVSILGLTYGDLRQKSSDNSGPSFGGVASLPVPQPPGGRLYAAARVVAEQDLNAPLQLQIVDAITQGVLVEKEITVKADQVTEWYVGYTVGEGGETSGVLWGDLSGAYLSDLPSFADTFTGKPDAASLPSMTTGQAWETPSTSLALVNGYATVTGAGQVSWFDTGTPWGTFSVLTGHIINSTGPDFQVNSVPLLYLGYLRLMNDGRVIDINTGRSVAGLDVNDGDSLTFDTMPSSLIPAGQRPGGIDDSVQSWACVISQNGAWVTTVATTRSFGTRRGLAGGIGQQFVAATWVPRAAGIPVGTSIPALPIPTDGAVGIEGTNWTTTSGQQWNALQLPAQSPPLPLDYYRASPIWAGNANSVIPPAFPLGGTAPPPPSTVLTSTRVDTTYGTLGFSVAQLAPTVDPTSYPIALLDNSTGLSLLQLQANGDLVRVTTAGVKTTLKVNAMPSWSIAYGRDLAIKFVQSDSLSSAFKTTYGITTQNQALIFLSNDAVVGVHSGNALFGQGDKGVYGLNDNAGHYTITSGWAWSPDAATVSTGGTAGGVSWGEVSGNGTKTWGELSINTDAVNLNPIYAQLIQSGASVDSWYLDTLSLFSDPIVWEFSNDAGHSWVPGYEVANNPDAIVAFTPKDPKDGLAVANKLCYRVTIWAPEYWISHLAIRPWYTGFLGGPPSRPEGSFQGPNVNPWDHYPPIEYDPRWKIWHLPIPRDWWFMFRTPDLTPRHITPYISDSIVLRS
jgi:hypothetical protein